MEGLFVEPHGIYVTKSVATYVQNQFEIIALNSIFFIGLALIFVWLFLTKFKKR